ncbi:MAG: hypothetical protein ACXAEF_09645 [Candidatus Thorarchaeota archaeon]|jgi:hypothetical protein
MMSWRKTDILKVVILGPLALVSILFAITSAGIVSFTQVTRFGVHSLFVYWACIPTAVILLSLRKKLTLSNMFYLSAFLIFILARIISAINSHYLLSELFQMTSYNLAGRILELGFFALLLLLGAFSRKGNEEYLESWKKGILFTLVIAVPVLLGSITRVLITFYTFDQLLNFSLVVTLLSCSCLFISPFVAHRYRNQDLSIDPGYMLTASIFLILTTITFFQSIQDVSSVWLIGENLEIGAFFVFGLAFNVPYLRKIGFRRLTSYVVFIVLGITSYAPLLVTTIIESTGLSEVGLIENVFAYTIIHVGFASLSFMMALLVYAYSRLKSSNTFYPLIPLFVVWSGVAITSNLAYIFPIVSRPGETITPYFMGGILTILLLRSLIRIDQDNSSSTTQVQPTHRIVIGAVLYISAVWIPDLLDQIIDLLLPGLELLQQGLIILIVTNFILMFLFSYTVFHLAIDAKRSISFKMYVVSFLSFWILPITLKSFFQIWTLGWWVSEVLLFIGVLLGPVVLSLLYIQAMRDMNESHSRAKLYADLLMHDITNYNQMALTTMELLASERLSKDERNRVISDAHKAVEMANQLVSNVRLLNETDDWMGSALFTVDIVKSVVRTVDLVTKSQRYPDRIIRLNSQIVHAYVMGNEFLDYALINFLYTALALPSKDREILLTVNPISNFDEEFWSIHLDVPDVLSERTGSDPISESLHQRIEQTLGYQVTKLIVEQMEGYVEVERTIDDDCIGILMSLNLPRSLEE